MPTPGALLWPGTPDVSSVTRLVSLTLLGVCSVCTGISWERPAVGHLSPPHLVHSAGWREDFSQACDTPVREAVEPLGPRARGLKESGIGCRSEGRAEDLEQGCPEQGSTVLLAVWATPEYLEAAI